MGIKEILPYKVIIKLRLEGHNSLSSGCQGQRLALTAAALLLAAGPLHSLGLWAEHTQVCSRSACLRSAQSRVSIHGPGSLSTRAQNSQGPHPVPSPRPCQWVTANWCQGDLLVPAAYLFSTSPAYIFVLWLTFLLCTITHTNLDGSMKESKLGNLERRKAVIIASKEWSKSSEAHSKCHPPWM